MQRVHWFIGDERFVPASHSLNNMLMARRLSSIAGATGQHPSHVTGAADPDEAAHRYETELKSFYGAGGLDPTRPLFDVVLMGVGLTAIRRRCFRVIPRWQRRSAGWLASRKRMSNRLCRASH